MADERANEMKGIAQNEWNTFLTASVNSILHFTQVTSKIAHAQFKRVNNTHFEHTGHPLPMSE